MSYVCLFVDSLPFYLSESEDSQTAVAMMDEVFP